jgi:hypothetical protein
MIRSVKQVMVQHNTSNEALLGITRELNVFLYENREAVPSENSYLRAAEMLSAEAGFEISMDRTIAILRLYPHARIKLAVYKDPTDTEVRGLLCDAISNFFLGCDWPIFDDGVDQDAYLKLLHQQAKAMEFA